MNAILATREHDRVPLGRTLLPWFSALRWVMIAVLAGALPASESLLGLHVDLTIALPALFAMAAMNVAQRWWHKNHPDAIGDGTIAIHAAFDMIAITVVLGASGGAANPFSAVLLVYIALAASLLSALHTFLLAALAACTFGTLFFVPGAETCHNPATSFSNHLYGMWVAFAVGASLVAFFLTRVRRALVERDHELEELRRRGEASAKFEAVGTLAAGAAHELGTPLGTICVIASELERQATQNRDAEGAALLIEQSRAIQSQVERCRSVLTRMRPGAHRTEPLFDTALAPSVHAAVSSWLAAHPEAHVELGPVDAANVTLSQADIEAAICVLLDNAHAATSEVGATDPIVVEARSIDGVAFVAVEDAGAGIAEDVAKHIGDPFFSTKGTGDGMGMGLFVVRSLLEEIGGHLVVENRLPRGTRVRLDFGAVKAPA